ncbi:SRPBCC family protein [Jiangella mangrovi]|uniref:Uncharacterized protein YndB with AHSA1/START domain n=1 Tax=Jiangella mangrovi TaxID=1524084 RepID=A0A7W9GSA3_9ACTN|nr:SRPBCC family protein [Jiangella mangrovi]MBB5789125.1 uncharacterized protein YndB with AHSA1/START domain [Jiangella mangrovi]
MTESLHTDGDRTVLRMERRFRHPRSRVWAAISEPGHLGQWFPAQVELSPVAGSDVSFDTGDGPSVDGRVIEAEPGRVLAFTWGDDHLRFELHDDGDGCRLDFAHTFADRYGAASFASGWVQCLVALDEVLDGVPVTAASPSAEQHDAYVERFGLDTGVASTGDDGGPRVRFERQLTAPAEAAWPVIERLAGTPADVRERDEPKVLAYTTAGGDDVRWELGEGTGHGARLVLTASGDDDAWAGRVAELARELRDRPQPS